MKTKINTGRKMGKHLTKNLVLKGVRFRAPKDSNIAVDGEVEVVLSPRGGSVTVSRGKKSETWHRAQLEQE